MNEGLQIENDCNFYANYSSEKKFRWGGGVDISNQHNRKIFKNIPILQLQRAKIMFNYTSYIASGHYDGNSPPPSNKP